MPKGRRFAFFGAIIELTLAQNRLCICLFTRRSLVYSRGFRRWIKLGGLLIPVYVIIYQPA